MPHRGSRPPPRSHFLLDTARVRPPRQRRGRGRNLTGKAHAFTGQPVVTAPGASCLGRGTIFPGAPEQASLLETSKDRVDAAIRQPRLLGDVQAIPWLERI